MYSTIIAVSFLIFFISNIRGQPSEDIPDSNSFTRDSEDLCPNSILSYSITNNTDSHCLQENFKNLQQCILSNFNQTSTFCSFCVIVNPFTFEDESNCECVKCVLETLTNNNCFQDICNEKELVLSQDSNDDLLNVTNDNFNVVTDDVKERIIEKYGNTLRQINYLQYLTDDSTGKVFRNFLPFEQKNLIKRLLSSWIENKNNDGGYEDEDDHEVSPDSMLSEDTIEVEEGLENEATINREENNGNHIFYPGWLKIGNKDFKTKTNPKIKKKAGLKTIFTVENDLKPVLLPTTTTNTIIHSTKALITETKTKLQAETRHTTVTKTDHIFKNEPKTITETKLEKTVHWQTEFKTKKDSEFIEKWKTKTESKFQIVTLTETEVNVSTKTILKQAFITVTDTRTYKTTKTKVVPKTTVTSTASKTHFKEKTITMTTFTTDVNIFTEKKKKFTVTATKLLTKTKVVTKKICKSTKTKTSIKKVTETFTVKKNNATKKRRFGRMLLNKEETATLIKRNLNSEYTFRSNATTGSKNHSLCENQSSMITSVTPMITELEINNKSSASRTLPFPRPFIKMSITIFVSSLFLFSLVYLIP